MKPLSLRSVPSHCLAWLAVLALAALPIRPVRAQATPPQSSSTVVTIDECRNLQDIAVRAKISDVAEASLKSELKGLSYTALVDKYWMEANAGSRLDKQIDDAVAAVRADSSWLDRAYSNVSQTTAERFATAVADRAYNSAEFKAALDDIATGIAKEIGVRLEAAGARVSNPVLACVQTALQSRYGQAVAQVFAQESQRNLDVSAEEGRAKIQAGDLVLSNAASISGIVLIVTRRVIGRMVASMGRRIAGVVASRIVSSVTGLIGLALIAKDIYDAGDGVFPIIAERMKSDDAKNAIKAEIAKSIETDVTSQLADIAQETADRIYSVWLDFKQKYQRLLDLAEHNSDFAAFLKDRKLDQLGKLGQIVDVVVGSEGNARLFERLKDGSLNRALLTLTEPGLKIATDTHSLDIALKWTELADDDLGRVADLGLYRTISPDQIGKDQLQKLLAVPDRGAIERIAALDSGSRDAILSLPQAQIREFARRLNEHELAAFANLRKKLDPGASRLLLREVAENPAVMRPLASQGLTDAIIGSRNQSAALDMALPSGEWLLSYGRIGKDAELVVNGEVQARVFAERYWLSMLAAGIVFLILLSWLRRLIFGSRPTIIIRSDGKSR
jgi:hypothetical protein